MKSAVVALLLVVCLNAKSIAQSFEGYIKYSFVMDMGAANNAKMAEANAKMNTPEMKAQMEALKKKMDDPEFKKMMESNPQLKAQMEAMMTMSQSGGLNNMLPKDITIQFKNGNSLYKVNGGAAAVAGDMLYLKDKDQSYSIHRDRKTYRVIPKTERKKSNATVTKTTETQTILGHVCTKYIVKDSLSIINIWATKELATIYEQMKKMSTNKDRNFYMDQVDGIPLKIESSRKEMHFTMQVIELKEQAEPAADFMIPAGFTEEKTK